MRKILCLLLLSILITPAFAADWSMFKNDVSHSGYTDDAVNAPLTLKWTKDLGFETDSSPVIVNGVLYIGSTFGVFALNTQTGKEIWRFQTDSFVKSVPAVSNGVIYFGTQNNVIYGLDANSGQLLWKNSTGKKDKDYITSPAISGNMLYAATHSGIVNAYSSGMAQTPTITSTQAATPIVTSSASPTGSPTVSTPKPEQTKKSPGFEYPVFVLLIMVVIGKYNKNK